MILKRKIFAKRNKPKLEKYPSYSKKQLQRMSLEDRYDILDGTAGVVVRNQKRIKNHSKEVGKSRGKNIGSAIGSAIGSGIGTITGTVSGAFKSNRNSRKGKRLMNKINRINMKEEQLLERGYSDKDDTKEKSNKDIIKKGTKDALKIGAGVGGAALVGNTAAGVATILSSHSGKRLSDNATVMARLKSSAPDVMVTVSDADSHFKQGVALVKKKNIVNINKSDQTAATLAHELGHVNYAGHGRRSKNIIGRGAHVAGNVSMAANHFKIPQVVSIVNGFNSGRKAVKAEQAGEKESTWNKTRAVAVPLAFKAPILIGEAAASEKGLRLLKKAGASKAMMRNARGNYAAALGTYATHAALSTAPALMARQAGKTYEKVKSRERKKDKKDSK